jgi:Tol biopolymer transport system component
MVAQQRVFLPLVVATALCACNSEPQPPAESAVPPPQASAASPPTPDTGFERVVYSSLRPGNWDIFYFASPGEPPRRLTSHPGLDYDAVLSPDGRWVVFTSERRGNPDLYVMDLEGGAPRLLIDSAAMEDQAAFSPDGTSLAFMSTQSGNADIYVLPFRPEATQAMAAATNLTNDPGGDFRPDFSPDGASIAFSTDRDTPVYGHPIFSFTRQREGDIYVMDRSGGNLRRLTNAPDWDGSPEWSADGRTIYFYSARPRDLPGPPTSPILGQEGGFRIWAMDADGGNPRALTREGTEALAPAVTGSGRVAYQTREGYARWSIKSVGADGTDERVESDGATDYWLPDYHAGSGAMVCHGVGPADVETQAVEEILGAGALLAADYPADVSLPDRSVTLYPMRHTTGLAPHPHRNDAAVTIENEAGSRLVLATFDGGNQKELLTVAGVGIVSGTPNRLFDIKWSDDGGWITYTQGFFFGQGSDEADVWIMRADGSERRNLSDGVAANEGVAAFAPDASKLVFRSAREGTFDLYLMNRDGSGLRRITNDESRDNFPVFSPAGDAIAFSSNRDGTRDRFGNLTFDNYVMTLAADGTPGEVRRISDHPGQDSHPWFSPDGTWIVYTSERAGISDEEPMVQEVVFGPQMYGELFAHRLSDGLEVRLTHNKWEEGNPFWMRPAVAER